MLLLLFIFGYGACFKCESERVFNAKLLSCYDFNIRNNIEAKFASLIPSECYENVGIIRDHYRCSLLQYDGDKWKKFCDSTEEDLILFCLTKKNRGNRRNELNPELVRLKPKSSIYLTESCSAESEECMARKINVTGQIEIILNEISFKRFLDKGIVQVLLFITSNGNIKQEFLDNFVEAGNQLEKYKIYFGLVDCNTLSDISYCSIEKANNYAYAFRNEEETISFPLTTLLTVDSIASSILHLAHINIIPIIQSVSDRRKIERNCWSENKDLVFFMQRSLGTSEHRAFIEIAIEFIPSFIFAVTTDRSGAHGLPFSKADESLALTESLIWVIQCSNLKKMNKDYTKNTCIPTSYRGSKDKTSLSKFLNSLSQPQWREIKRKDDMSGLSDEFHWVIFVYDNSSKKRVFSLVPSLSQLLRGSLMIFTLNSANMDSELENVLDIKKNLLNCPSILFYCPSERKTISYINDFDDALSWINRQMLFLPKKLNEDSFSYNEDSEPEEDILQQDDEVARDMVSEHFFTEVPTINGWNEFSNIICKRNRPLVAIVFYVSWDPVSNILLQHLQLAAPNIKRANFYRMNCFNWPKLCSKISSYPVLEFYGTNGHNITYNGRLEETSIIESLSVLNCNEILASEHYNSQEEFIKIVNSCLKTKSTRVLGIFPENNQGGNNFRKVMQTLKWSHIVGVIINSNQTRKSCKNDVGCILLTKPSDIFLPKFVVKPVPMQANYLMDLLRIHDTDVFTVPDYIRFYRSKDSIQFILILSNLSEEDVIEKYKVSTKSPQTHKEKRIFNIVGTLAAEFTSIDVAFSYLFYKYDMVKEFLSSHKVKLEDTLLLALDKQKGISMFESDNGFVPSEISQWIQDVINGHVEPAVFLPKHKWEPENEAIDYLRLMDEDAEIEEQIQDDIESNLEQYP